MKNQLIAYRGCKLTTDTTQAIARVEQQAFSLGNVKIHIETTSQLDGVGLWDAGREVCICMTYKDSKQPVPVSQIWGLAIPQGFTPWDRYPIDSSPTKNTFLYLGEWQRLFDSLLGEGQGEYAFPSVQTAARIEAGVYQGDRKVECTVQAYLHHLGIPCGPVNGQITDRCVRAIQALGMKAGSLEEMIPQLAKMTPPSGKLSDTDSYGHIICSRISQVNAYGNVQTTRTPMGAEISIQGPGRIVLDIS